MFEQSDGLDCFVEEGESVEGRWIAAGLRGLLQ